jgi:hypothetical protein
MAPRSEPPAAAGPKGRLRKLIGAALPPELRRLLKKTPSTTDPEWLAEMGRALMVLFLHATRQAFATDDPILQAHWAARAERLAEELRQLKALELKIDQDQVPTDLHFSWVPLPVKHGRKS